MEDAGQWDPSNPLIAALSALMGMDVEQQPDPARPTVIEQPKDPAHPTVTAPSTHFEMCAEKQEPSQPTATTLRAKKQEPSHSTAADLSQPPVETTDTPHQEPSSAADLPTPPDGTTHVNQPEPSAAATAASPLEPAILQLPPSSDVAGDSTSAKRIFSRRRRTNTAQQQLSVSSQHVADAKKTTRAAADTPTNAKATAAAPASAKNATTTQTELRFVLQTPLDDNSFVCAACCKNLKRKDSLSNHFARDHDRLLKFVYRCRTCNSEFEELRVANAHSKQCPAEAQAPQNEDDETEQHGPPPKKLRTAGKSSKSSKSKKTPKTPAAKKSSSSRVGASQPVMTRSAAKAAAAANVDAASSNIVPPAANTNAAAGTVAASSANVPAPAIVPPSVDWERSFFTELGRSLMENPEAGGSLMDAVPFFRNITKNVVMQMNSDQK